MNRATEALTELASRTDGMLPGGCTGAGDPVRRVAKVINGHKVTCRAIGWDDRPVIFEVDGSTEPLTLAQAAEAVA